MKEIGSEFHYFTNDRIMDNFLPCGINDYSMTFSGRTAIEVVLKNISNAKKALLPSYCCESIIEPFRRADIEITFYNVNYKEGLSIELEISSDIDVILWCNYFGFVHKMPDLSEFIKRGGIIIEDITHSFLSDSPYHEQSHFLVASIRKWLPVLSGGYCASRIGELNYKPAMKVSDEFLRIKKQAMMEKAGFLNNKDCVSKDSFLEKFTFCNKWLSKNYSNLIIDEESLDIIRKADKEAIKKVHRDNAKVIYRSLESKEYVKPLFKEEEMDIPLFVPVIVDSKYRDKIRNKLIEHKIYCPVHWPKPKDDCESDLYSAEISLICDQRYDEQDIKQMMSVI